ncbi:MAG: hypothetical protein JSV56_05405 [Methanomassiliicoccales archaeon]|nr:MAG: hypothetical protein JSV56_05405 [Methanomassiliicoccales archaeon]
MEVTVSENKTIEIDEEIIEFLKQQDEDFRISTSCYGPILIPVSMKPPKKSDIKVNFGKRTLHISMVQAAYLSKVDKSMLMGSSLSDLERCFL